MLNGGILESISLGSGIEEAWVRIPVSYIANAFINVLLQLFLVRRDLRNMEEPIDGVNWDAANCVGLLDSGQKGGGLQGFDGLHSEVLAQKHGCYDESVFCIK